MTRLFVILFQALEYMKQLKTGIEVEKVKAQNFLQNGNKVSLGFLLVDFSFFSMSLALFLGMCFVL